jgi:hypothetical protein
MGVPVGEGTAVTLRGGEEEYQATVRRCVAELNGYLASVCFVGQSHTYVPEHLLDVTRLNYSEEP